MNRQRKRTATRKLVLTLVFSRTGLLKRIQSELEQ